MDLTPFILPATGGVYIAANVLLDRAKAKVERAKRQAVAQYAATHGAYDWSTELTLTGLSPEQCRAVCDHERDIRHEGLLERAVEEWK